MPFRTIAHCTGCALFLLAACPSPAAAPESPEVLQTRGVQGVERFIDHFRKTGDHASLLPQLLEAEGALAPAYDTFIAQRNGASAALSIQWLGDAERMQDHWDLAYEYYRRAREAAQQGGNIGYQAKAMMGMAKVEGYGRNHLGIAAAGATQAIILAQDAGDPDVLFDAFDLAGQFQLKLGNINAAAQDALQALQLEGRLKDKARAYYGYVDNGDVYLQLGNQCDDKTTFQVCYQAYELARTAYQKSQQIAADLGFTFLAAQSAGFLRELDTRESMLKSREHVAGNIGNLTKDGGALFHPKQPSEVLVTKHFAPGPNPAGMAAVKLAMQQLPPGANASDPRSAYVEGMFQEMSGNNDAALAAYLSAADLLDKDRSRLQDDRSRSSFLADKIGIYYAPVLLLLDRGRNADAFRRMEQSRSRAMTDLLQSRQVAFATPRERDLFASSRELEAKVALLQKQLFLASTAAPGAGRDQTIADVQGQIKTLETESDKMNRRIGDESPKMHDLLVSEPVTLDAAQRAALEEGYDLIYYLVLDSALIVWHISGKDVSVQNVFITHSALAEKVAALRASLADNPGHPHYDQRTSRELFLFLMQPLLKSLQTHHLVIVPHEELNALPFQVLENPADGSFLGERYQVTYIPSATLLASLKRTPNLAAGRLLGVADPSLQYAVEEVETIATLYPGRSKISVDALATKADIRALVPHYSIVHLSVHGTFDSNEPMLSALKLKATAGDDGRYSASEMFGLPLAKDSLVVLSACETGRVEATHSNEIFGIERALLYAGANDLVLSSWRVQSRATAQWMETFYHEAQTVSLGEAARRALVSVKSVPEFHEPYFWGAFSVVGK
jgi:CHAT domain-containing protein